MMAPVLFSEALALGLASGPACIAACGPVLVPALLAGQAGMRPSLRFLAVFLGARLAGYLLFAALAWELGVLASALTTNRLPMIGWVYVLLAGVLLWYAYSVGKRCSSACAGSKLVTIGEKESGRTEIQEKGGKGISGSAGPAALGFLTGLNLCPPFVAAGIRASGLESAGQALLFFTFFFVGTSVWFVPFAGMSCVVRNQAVTTVARMAMALIAVCYFSMGIVMVLGRKAYGY